MCRVFDDWLSFIHFGVGIASSFFPHLLPYLTMGVVAYEVIEDLIKLRKLVCWYADVTEYLAGVGLGYALLSALAL